MKILASVYIVKILLIDSKKNCAIANHSKIINMQVSLIIIISNSFFQILTNTKKHKGYVYVQNIMFIISYIIIRLKVIYIYIYYF